MLGQLKNFGAKAKIKPEPTYFFSTYTYVRYNSRESGLGCSMATVLPKYSIDVAAYSIKP
jgi:hypothetical protein